MLRRKGINNKHMKKALLHNSQMERAKCVKPNVANLSI